MSISNYMARPGIVTGRTGTWVKQWCSDPWQMAKLRVSIDLERWSSSNLSGWQGPKLRDASGGERTSYPAWEQEGVDR